MALRFTEPTRRAARHARRAGARPHAHASPFHINDRIESCGRDELSQRLRNTALTSLGCEVGLQFFFLLLCACKPLQQPIRVRASDKEGLHREVDSWNTSLMDVAGAISGEARRFLLRYWKLSKSDTLLHFQRLDLAEGRPESTAKSMHGL